MATTREEYEFIARFRAEALDAARQAQEALEGIGDGAERATQQAQDSADALEQIGVAVGAAASAFLIAQQTLSVVADGLGEFASFETQMTAIAKVSNLTASELDALGSRFEALAGDVGIQVEQFTEAATVAGQLGVDGVANIESFTNAIVQLGGASNLQGEEAASTIARILNITGEGYAEAGRFASVLVELGNNVAATEAEIANIAGEVARATASFDTSSTFAAGMGAAMAELGLRAETAGTAVGRIFSEMALAAATGSEEAGMFADAMGLTVEQFEALQKSSPTDAFMLFLRQLNAMGNTEALVVLDELKLANAETVKSLTPLITNYERFTDVLNMANREAANPDALNNEAMAAAATLAREYAGLLEMVRTELRELGEIWAPVASALIDGAKAIIDAFNALPEGLQDFIMIVATIAPTVLAAKLAIVALVATMGLFVPASVRMTAAAGATAAGLAGMGRAGQVAGAGLAVARAGLTALLGPVGLVVAAGTALYYALGAGQDGVVDITSATAEAEGTMRAYADAVERAAEEQKGLRDGTTEATKAMLEQARSELQILRDELQRDVSVALQVELDDAHARDVKGELEALSQLLTDDLRLNPPNADMLADTLVMIDQLRNGLTSFDQFRDRFNAMTAVGEDAIAVVSRYRNEFSAYEGEVFGQDALNNLIRYAQEAGIFDDELQAIRAALAGGDEQAMLLAVADLAREMELAGEHGEYLRDLLPETFMQAVDDAADAEVALAAVKAQLEGNHELAELILETGNPFAQIEAGAVDAAEEVAALAAETMKVLGLTGKLAEMKITTPEGFEAFYSMGGRTGSDDYSELVRATVALAERMDMSAKDLLTIFSYETGGTLDPWQAGPTTQHGQHRGLIQWGEPQAAQYGVTATMTIAEQVAAVERYLRDRGVTNGDSLLRVYAAINAGSPDAINATDENNGGAAGTVYDKVNEQFDAHADRAEGLLAAYGGVVNTVTEEFKEAERAAKEAEREAERTLEQRIKDEQEAIEARKEFLELNKQAIADAEFEASLAGKSAAEQARLRTEYELLNQARKEGIDVDKELTASGRTYREEITATAQALGELAGQEEARAKAAEQAKERQEFLNQAQEDFQQGILDAILEGESLIDVLGNLAKAFARAALEAALFNSGPFSTGGTGGGLLGGLVSTLFSAKGNIYADGGIQPFAKGGVMYQSAIVPMAKGGRALIGEAGPEAIMPLDRAPDGTLGVRNLGGGQQSTTLNYQPTFVIQSDGTTTQTEGGATGASQQERFMQALDNEVRAKVLEVLQRELTNGGMLNPAVKPYG